VRNANVSVKFAFVLSSPRTCTLLSAIPRRGSEAAVGAFLLAIEVSNSHQITPFQVVVESKVCSHHVVVIIL
jgi:hypothetical protein